MAQGRAQDARVKNFARQMLLDHGQMDHQVLEFARRRDIRLTETSNRP